MSFRISPVWKDETAVILGGGPSLTLEAMWWVQQSNFRRIACNTAFMVDPEADVVCWADARWFYENRATLQAFKGLMLTWHEISNLKKLPVKMLQHRNTASPSHGARSCFSLDPGTVSGSFTGYGAVNIAYHFGVSRIVLLGFDMTAKGGNNWHNLHIRHATEERYKRCFIPEMQEAGRVLESRGIEVINATPGSALTCFPYQPIDEIVRGAVCVEL